ncbi:DUF1003 domain-containing protein [Roseisolibacter sp. H3M3-2]|uniref:DUF1003 domain-containing protein n=1 Tax=Roseisolibacter sp. H3M3-2 TaxID=3031323 RepID=UPI0023DA13A8|nr:DUF1003 domain-containing protein [Roseisolibacter sp. H3M3-2]MDF1504485.1 DUF1003 domain-containing protein [Roseisolibacter sp. H3M3-2]
MPQSIFAADQRAQARRLAADRKVEAIRTRLSAHQSPVEQVADALTRFASSTVFLALHLIWFSVWVAWNSLARFPFDPYPFGFLTMVVSLEAIFLSIFVLMSQRRESQIAELREEMTLEIDMRTEEEVTKTLQLVAGLYGRLGLPLSTDDEAELQAMLRPLDRDRLSEELAAQIERPRAPAPEPPASVLITLPGSDDR